MGKARLDHYMAQLGSRLHALSSTQRAEDLYEVRQHLDALVAGHIARGHSEADAVELAIRQFGHAEHVGRELAAVQRQRHAPLWPALLIYACVVAVIFALLATANDKPTDFPYGWVDQLVLALVLPAGFLAAQISRYLRLRKAST